MSEVQAVSDIDYNETIAFLNKNLRPESSWSITDEYPLALQPGNRQNIFFVREGGTVAAAAALKTFLLKSPTGLFKVGGIGSVVTAPEFRQKGYSRKVIDRIIHESRNQACDIVILWSELHDFYRKLGFELAGREVALRLDHEVTVPSPKDISFNESSAVSPDAIARIYTQHTVGCIRSAEDIRKSLKIPKSRVFTAWGSNQQMVAYAVTGKGADLTNYVHEWGGSVSNLLPLLAFARKSIGAPITVIAPAHSTNFIRQIEEWGVHRFDGALGLVKIVNPDLLFTKIQRHIRQLGIENFVLERRGSIFVFGFKDQLFQTDSEQDIVKMIFGPARASTLAPFGPEVSAVMDRVFPVSFWIWGWDSV